MKRIASFTVNHDILERGMYISRIYDEVKRRPKYIISKIK